MKTINVETILFESIEEKNKTKNYPNSGIFESQAKGGFFDLVFVDKKQVYVFYICPIDFFDSFHIYQIEKQDVPRISKQIKEPKNESIKYDGDFILEFARILLNRK